MSEAAAKPKRIAVIGQTPPPMGGQAQMIAHLLSANTDGIQLRHVPMSFTRRLGESGHVSLGKVLVLAKVLWCVLLERVRGVRLAYYPASGASRASLYRDIVVLVWLRALRFQVLLHFHASGLSESITNRTKVEQWLAKVAYQGHAGAIKLSPLAPQDAEYCLPSRIFVVPNGVEDPRVVWGKSRAKPETNLVRVLHVGIIGEPKGAFRLLDAAEELVRRGHAIEIILVGDLDGRLSEQALWRYIEERQLTPWVRWLGVLSGLEKHRAYECADIMCFPTLFEHETFPLVLLEAFAYSLPVVASDWRAIPDIVDHGTNGYLAKNADGDELVEFLSTLIRDKQKRLWMGGQARRKFEERYTIDEFSKRMGDVLMQFAGGVR